MLRYQYEYYTREPSAVSSRVARNFPSSANGVASELKAYGDAQLLQTGVFTIIIIIIIIIIMRMMMMLTMM